MVGHAIPHSRLGVRPSRRSLRRAHRRMSGRRDGRRHQRRTATRRPHQQRVSQHLTTATGRLHLHQPIRRDSGRIHRVGSRHLRGRRRKRAHTDAEAHHAVASTQPGVRQQHLRRHRADAGRPTGGRSVRHRKPTANNDPTPPLTRPKPIRRSWVALLARSVR